MVLSSCVPSKHCHCLISAIADAGKMRAYWSSAPGSIKKTGANLRVFPRFAPEVSL